MLVMMLWLVIRFLWMILTLVMRFWNVSFSRCTMNIAFIVTSSYVFIEICSVAAIEGVLLPIMVAKMVNLKTLKQKSNEILPETTPEFEQLYLTIGLRVSVVSAGMFTATVEAGVGF